MITEEIADTNVLLIVGNLHLVENDMESIICIFLFSFLYFCFVRLKIEYSKKIVTGSIC